MSQVPGAPQGPLPESSSDDADASIPTPPIGDASGVSEADPASLPEPEPIPDADTPPASSASRAER